MKRYLFTSESVSPGHPDKIADQISDAILDEYLKEDPDSKVACETLVTTGLVIVAGEVKSKVKLDHDKIIRRTIEEIGYTDSSIGFDYKSVGILTSIHEQSSDISMGVEEGEGLFKEQGAGDQGMMFGYATNETPEFMPTTIAYSNRLVRELVRLRKEGIIDYLYPDAKTQVTVLYENDKPVKITSVVVSTQHKDSISREQIENDIIEKLIKPVCGDLIDSDTKFYINPTGRFVIGGPAGDTGLTGRKIIVDTYGGHGSHGGGAFSGKDPSKVDRSAAYAARYIAKNIVASGIASKVLVQLAYAIGVAEPVSIYVNTYGTSQVDEEKIVDAIRKIFPLKPKDIIEKLDLKRPIYKKTAALGHFGRDEEEFTWERLDKVEDIKNYFNL